MKLLGLDHIGIVVRHINETIARAGDTVDGREDKMAKSSRNERIISRVRAIPKGFVRTYGDIDPLAPRLVGRILSQTHDIPWHRVVRADGTLPQGEAQRKLLVAEGVPMRGERVDLDEARLPREL